MTNSPPENTANSPVRRRRVGLSTVLVGGIMLLILLAVGSVLWVTLTSATRNTFELLGERATAHANSEYALAPLGAHEIRGREGTVEIFRLDTRGPDS